MMIDDTIKLGDGITKIDDTAVNKIQMMTPRGEFHLVYRRSFMQVGLY